MDVRQGAHRWGKGALCVLLLAACGPAAADTPQTLVAGVQVERQVTVEPARSAAPSAGAGAWSFEPTPDTVGWLGGAAGESRPESFEAIVAAAAARWTMVVPTASAGEFPTSAVIGGVERRWMSVPPPTGIDRGAMLIVLHGVGGTGAGMRRFGFDALAAQAGVTVVYPDAHNGSWNDGRPRMEPPEGTPVDDLAFLRELIARSTSLYRIDPTRVAIVGFSNGALMAARAACDMTDQLRAVVLVGGAGPRDVTQRCRPSRPLPVMLVMGTKDPVVPYDGGQVASFSGKSRGQVAPVREVLDVWRAANGCTAPDTQAVLTTKPLVATWIRSSSCRAPLEHMRVTGGGHDWFVAPHFDTTGAAWRFVQTQLG